MGSGSVPKRRNAKSPIESTAKQNSAAISKNAALQKKSPQTYWNVLVFVWQRDVKDRILQNYAPQTLLTGKPSQFWFYGTYLGLAMKGFLNVKLDLFPNNCNVVTLRSEVLTTSWSEKPECDHKKARIGLMIESCENPFLPSNGFGSGYEVADASSAASGDKYVNFIMQPEEEVGQQNRNRKKKKEEVICNPNWGILMTKWLCCSISYILYTLLWRERWGLCWVADPKGWPRMTHSTRLNPFMINISWFFMTSKNDYTSLSKMCSTFQCRYFIRSYQQDIPGTPSWSPYCNESKNLNCGFIHFHIGMVQQ